MVTLIPLEFAVRPVSPNFHSLFDSSFEVPNNFFWMVKYLA